MINDNTPIFKIVVTEDDETTGMDMLSLVEYPAIDVNFLKFSDESNKIKFASDNYKQIITGPSLIPDKPIYRLTDDNEPYYVVFDADTIEMIVNKFFRNEYTSNINYNHNKELADSYIFESWIITDPDNDKSKALGFADLPAGTWMTSVKINSKEFWEKEVLSGNLKGFSVEIKAKLDEIDLKKYKKKDKKKKYKYSSELNELLTLTDELINLLTDDLEK